MKQKYWMVSCPHCNGGGRFPARFSGYRISEELQDEGPYLLKDEFPTLKDAKEKIDIIRDSSIVHHIIAPDGEIIE